MTMRSVQDRFWSDGWVRKLNPLDRYLFLYLLTNEHTNWSGVYELEIGMMAYESGIDREELERSMLPRLSPKVIYVDGWVYVPNWLKHHHSERGKLTPDQEAGVKKAWESVPDRIRLKIKDIQDSWGIPPSLPPTYPPVPVPSASALSSASISELRSDIVIVKDEEEKPQKADKRVKEKESVFLLFGGRQAWWLSASQRTAALALLDNYGYDQVAKAVALVKASQDDPFCPKPTTPAQLVEKWGALLNYRNKNL